VKRSHLARWKFSRRERGEFNAAVQFDEAGRFPDCDAAMIDKAGFVLTLRQKSAALRAVAVLPSRNKNDFELSS